jgi:hypothetical protein
MSDKNGKKHSPLTVYHSPSNYGYSVFKHQKKRSGYALDLPMILA